MTYTSEELDDKIEEWHWGATTADLLWDHLGWTQEQYRHWVETGEQP